jgi:two-component system, NarL family, response regulator LiaR
MMRIILADDFAPFRRFIRVFLATCSGFEIVAEVGDGVAAVQFAGKLKPDIILLDIDMPMLDGLNAAEQIVATNPNTRVIMVTANGSSELVNRAFELGVHGYLLKDQLGKELIPALESVRVGNTYVSAGLGRT